MDYSLLQGKSFRLEDLLDRVNSYEFQVQFMDEDFGNKLMDGILSEDSIFGPLLSSLVGSAKAAEELGEEISIETAMSRVVFVLALEKEIRDLLKG